jgi:hypothetical protein
MRRYLIFASVAALGISTLQGAVADDVMGVGSLDIPAVYALDKCSSATQLDCIESVGLLANDGTYSNATLSKSELSGTYVDSNGNKIYNGSTIWSATNKLITVRGSLETPQHILLKNSETDIHYGAALRISVDVENPLETKVRIKVRTSWLRPQSVQVKLNDSNFVDEIIPGGHRWTFEGKGLPHSSYDYSKGPVDITGMQKADYDAVLFDIFVHHAGIDSDHSYWPPICADQGYTVQSNNTNATGEPSWNASDQTLQFGIFAPHFTAAGALNNGYFKFWTTDKFLNCKFPTNTLSKSPNLAVQILYEDGTEAVATTQVTHANGKISVVAAGFHFSSPKIVIKPLANETVAPTAKPKVTPLVKSIKCKKGKTTKVITGVNPVCPAGYKKVS